MCGRRSQRGSRRGRYGINAGKGESLPTQLAALPLPLPRISCSAVISPAGWSETISTKSFLHARYLCQVIFSLKNDRRAPAMIRAASQAQILKRGGVLHVCRGRMGVCGVLNPLSSIHFLHFCYHSQNAKRSEWQP